MTPKFSLAIAVACSLSVAGLSGTAAASELPGSPEFGGYEFPISSTSISTLSVQFTVPTIDCQGNTGTQEFTAQIMGAADSVSASIAAGCNDGVSAYAVVAFDSPLSLSVNAGDKVALRCYADPAVQKNGEKVTVDDITTGESDTRESGPLEFKPVSVWIGVVPTSQPYLPDFGRVQWVKALFNGHPFGSFEPQGYNLTVGNHNSKLVAFTSALTTSGLSFRNSWISGKKAALSVSRVS